MPQSSPPIPPPPPQLRLPPAERMLVDPRTLALSPYLMRDTIDAEHLKALVQSVRHAGFARAATGMRRANGTIELTTGKRLWLAAKELNCELPIDVRPEGPLVPIVEALLAHTHTMPPTPFEEGRLYRAALQQISRVLGYKVTQSMLAGWLVINEAILSASLTIVRRLTPEFVREAGVEFSALKNRSRRSLYKVARIRDPAVRAAHLVHLVTGSWPAGYGPQEEAAAPPYSRRDYGARTTYSIRDRSRITDTELDDLWAVIRSDVAIARRAARAEAAA